MKVYWLEQTQADIRDGDAWLSASESVRLRALRFPKRRTDWLLGRWTAKNAAALFLGHSTEPQALQNIEIRAALSGAPEVFISNKLADVAISLSHRAGIAACVVAPSPVLLGCDLEMAEPHGDAFVTDYFTAEEQALISEAEVTDRLLLVALLWSSKESALKALGEGLRVDTRSVTVSLAVVPEGQGANDQEPARRMSPAVRYTSEHNDWSPLQVLNINGQIFRGWWSQVGSLIRTMVANQPSDPPILFVPEYTVTR